MTHHRRIAAIVLLGLALLAADCIAATPPDSVQSARCQVWVRELGFAQSVARHDAVAFAGYVHAHAVFGVGSKPVRGREAIVAEWQGIIDGTALRLEWYPDLVVEGGDGSIVHSSGPALMQDPATGNTRHSRFNSVWQRDGSGQWQVVFDDGTRPQAADAAAVQAFRAGRVGRCPEA